MAAINAHSAATGVTAVLNSDNGIDLTAEDGRNIHVSTNSPAANKWFSADTHLSSLTMTSNDDFVLGGSTDAEAMTGTNTTLYTQDFSDTVSSMNVSTKSGANAALAVLDSAIDNVASQRSNLGALQNRLESTVSNLQSVSQNLTAAKSRIEDADFASETAALTKRLTFRKKRLTHSCWDVRFWTPPRKRASSLRKRRLF